jgi:hypothetical protein
MLCDAQIENGRRRIILSSTVRIFNNTTLPLLIVNVDSVDTKKYEQIAKIDINKDFYFPIDLLYAHSNSSVFIAVDE